MKSLDLLLANLSSGYRASRSEVSVPNFVFGRRLLDLFYKEGFILGYRILGTKIVVYLKYWGRRPAVKFIKRVSTVSKKVFISKSTLVRSYATGTKVVVSNNQGLFLYGVGHKPVSGGEVLIEIE
jgi:ribosomal protein S8